MDQYTDVDLNLPDAAADAGNGAGPRAGPDADADADVEPGDGAIGRRRGGRHGSSNREPLRTLNACQVCRQKKVKCDGRRPCEYCAKRCLRCVFFTAEKRKLYSVSQIRELEQKVARYETQRPAEETTSSSARVGDDSTCVGPTMTPENQAVEAETIPQSQQPATMSTPGMNSPTSLDVLETNSQIHSYHHLSVQRTSSERVSRSSILAGAGSGSRATIAPESALSSSETFGSEIRTFLVSHSNAASMEDTTALAATPSQCIGLEELERLREWPSSADEARELLELVVLNVGISQQLFDIRPFSDTLPLLYSGSSSSTSFPPLWTVKALLVMAIGRLLQAKDPDSEIPGESLFNEAMESLPSPHGLLKYGIHAVELTALAGLFLQVADRKVEAYLYASISLRLAIAQGMHKANLGDMARYSSTYVHRNRLWWTVYMQERRLTAAAGYPVTLHDRSITVDPPEDVPGFASAAAIAMNVRAARITGQITWTIYSQTSTSEASFITDVNHILHSLDDLEKSMPAEYVMDLRKMEIHVAGRPFSETHIHTARTSSSLYLSIHLAAVHAVRPILLYMARRSREHDTNPQSVGHPSPLVRRIAELCVEAASKSLVILQELRGREIIAKHAFLDLDAVFSVGFVFVLVEVISPGKGFGACGIEASRSILRYLVRLGNRAASRRLSELDQMCAHLGQLPLQPPSQILPTAMLSQSFSFEHGWHNPEATPAASRGECTILRPGDSYMNTTVAGVVGEMPSNEGHAIDPSFNTSLSGISLEGEDELLWAFQPGYYTGAELTDWETLGQHMPEVPHP